LVFNLTQTGNQFTEEMLLCQEKIGESQDILIYGKNLKKIHVFAIKSGVSDCHYELMLPRSYNAFLENKLIVEPPFIQAYFELEKIVKDYLGITPKNRNGYFSGEPPKDLRNILKELEILKTNRCLMKQGLKSIVQISQRMGNQHPILKAAQKCGYPMTHKIDVAISESPEHSQNQQDAPKNEDPKPLQSNLSDDRVVIELREILGYLQEANISKKPDGYIEETASSNIQSEPIVLPTPKAAVEGLRLQDERSAFEAGEPKFEAWLKEKNLIATKVSGKDLNCFIYSLLQHVTGKYNVEDFDDNLIHRIKGGAGVSLDPVMRYPDTPDSLKIVKAINKLYKINLEVSSIQIDNEGKSIILSPLFDSNNTLGQRSPVILWLQVNHYVAVTSLRLSKKMTEQETTVMSVVVGEDERTTLEGDMKGVKQQQLIEHGKYEEINREAKARTEGEAARRLGSSTPMLDMNQGLAASIVYSSAAEQADRPFKQELS
jgi:hypothetical protein